MAITTYPLDNIDYNASDAALFHCTRTSGVYAQEDFSYSVSGADNMVKVGPGIAWMRINRFKGQVVAMMNETSVDMGLADPVYPRIDRLILQFSANKNATQMVAKHGAAASNPLPPERSVSEDLYELHLLEVRRDPGAVAIKAKDVTDLRMNPDLCGLMAESVTKIDTAGIYAQVMALIEALKEEVQNAKAGTAFVMKSGDTMTGDLDMAGHSIIGAKLEEYAAVTLTTSGWSASAPYTQTVPVAGVTAEKPPHVAPVFSGNAAADIALKEACAAVSCAKPGNGTLTFTCLEDKPGLDIPVQVEVRL